MRHRMIHILIVLLVSLDFSIKADTNSNPSGTTIIITPTKPTGNRPKSPSRQEVTCLYIEDSLYINFAIPEGECNLYLYDLTTGETISATFDSYESEPIYIGYHNSAEITIDTQSGNSYSGTW